MKKSTWFSILLVAVAVLFVSISVVLAQPNRPMECLMDIEYDEHEEGVFYWYGPVYGCELEGFVRFDADPSKQPFFAGNTLHYFELFTIYPSSGGEIYGYDEGVGDYFNRFKFRANGWVTDVSPGASSSWGHLVGYKFMEMGTSSDPATGLPGIAHKTLMRLVPTERPVQ